MNTGFYKDLDTNFEKACNLSEKEFSHSELLYLLNVGNIPEKQIAALKFDYVDNEEEAQLLLSNLTGCDGKIREAIALKIYQMLSKSNDTRNFFASLPSKVYADATIDINANICRLVTDSVTFLRCNSEFAHEYTEYLLQYSLQALNTLDAFGFRDKKYVVNKQLFKLYWCLESLRNFYQYAEEEQLLNVLTRSASQSEYTIREKVAQIVMLSDKYSDLQELLRNDNNYYVRAVFLNH